MSHEPAIEKLGLFSAMAVSSAPRLTDEEIQLNIAITRGEEDEKKREQKIP